jgi:nitroreductase
LCYRGRITAGYSKIAHGSSKITGKEGILGVESTDISFDSVYARVLEAAMGLLEVIQKRYSCRAYEDKSVEQGKLDTIFEAARLAPSACNFQDWRFVAVSEPGAKRKIAETTNKPDAFGKAGVLIVACSNNSHVMKCGQAVGPIDVSIALEHIALMATELGLATCWIGSFDAEKVREILAIPEGVAIIEVMALGYPAQKAGKTTRESAEKIVCYDSWQF